MRNFYDIEDLEAATHALAEAATAGNQLLYADGGRAVKNWYDRVTA